jgi:hypothetical protein
MEQGIDSMIIGDQPYQFEWIDNWARIPDTRSGRENGRTHGAVVTKDGDVVVFCQADPSVLIYSPDGELKDSWGDRFLGAHGMTIVDEGGVEFLWLTDQDTGEVVKTTLAGETVLNLERADHPIYETRKYFPTWATVNEERFGGNGDIWVADGYGSFYLHRYDKNGTYLSSLSGEEGAGRFNCPHGVWTDMRSGQPELYVADRGNKQFQVFAMDGSFIRAFGSDYMTSPDGSSSYPGGALLVPELFARITIVDDKDQPAAYLGSNEPVCKIDGWPNHDPALIEVGKFNSPHGAVADAEGNIYVVEWIVGGRITKLRRV